MDTLLWLIGIAIVAWWALKPSKRGKQSNDSYRIADSQWKRENRNRRVKHYLPNGDEVVDPPKSFFH